MRTLGLSALGAAAIATVMVGCSDSKLVSPTAPGIERNTLGTIIPAGYVATPNGWYHESCVHEVEAGAHVSRHGMVRRRDGSELQIPACKYKPLGTHRLTSQLSPISTPTDSGWIEYAYTTTAHTYSALSATWTVPPVPVTFGGLYFTFPGLESDAFIIQPVLQFGTSGAGGGNSWAIASWHCNSGSDCTHSALKAVNAGDQMHGTVAATACSNGSCTWTITTTDVTTGAQTALSVDDTVGYSWATGGAVEVYSITSCDQYPINGVDYSSISLTDSQLGLITPSWLALQMSPTPNCNFGVTTTSSTVDLAHNPGSNIASGGLTASVSVSCTFNCATPDIVSVTAHGTSSITVKDNYGHVGTISLVGVTANGGLTASTTPGCLGCVPAALTSVQSTASTVTIKDNYGHTGTLTLTGATVAGGLTASVQPCVFDCAAPFIASIIARSDAFIIGDTYSHTGLARLAY